MLIDIDTTGNTLLSKIKIGTWLITLTLKQKHQRLLIPLAQVELGNNSESLLNEMRQIVYSLY